MKKYLILLSTVFLVSSCQEAVSEDPQVILDKAWKKQIEKQQVYQKGTLEYSGNLKLSFDQNNVELSGSGDLAFDQTQEEKKAGLQVDLSGKGTLEGKKATIALQGETRFVNDKVYVNIGNLDLDTDEPQVNLMANLVGNYYKDQWVEIPFDLFKGAGFSLYSPSSPKAKELQEVAENHSVLDIVKDLGKRTYEVTVNPEKLDKYIDAIAAVDPLAATPESKEALLQFFSQVKYTAQVRISKKYDFEWVKIEGETRDTENAQSVKISLDASLGKRSTEAKGTLEYQGSVPGSLKFQFNVTDKSRNASVEIPQDAQPFDLGALLGGGLGKSDDTE